MPCLDRRALWAFAFAMGLLGTCGCHESSKHDPNGGIAAESVTVGVDVEESSTVNGWTPSRLALLESLSLDGLLFDCEDHHEEANEPTRSLIIRAQEASTTTSKASPI